MSNKCNCQIPNTDMGGRCFKCGGFVEIPISKTMTPRERIKVDAEKYIDQIHCHVGDMEYEAYITGATAVHDRAQNLADDVQLMLDQFELSPELAWFEIAQNMKRIGRKALEQWKGKEVEP